MDRLRQVDWRDALLHVLGGAALAAILVPFGIAPVESAPAIAAFGFVREWVQAFRMSRELNPLRWSVDKWVEFLAWPVGAVALAGLMAALGAMIALAV